MRLGWCRCDLDLVEEDEFLAFVRTRATRLDVVLNEIPGAPVVDRMIDRQMAIAERACEP
jgi:hypothetical protein